MKNALLNGILAKYYRTPVNSKMHIANTKGTWQVTSKVANAATYSSNNTVAQARNYEGRKKKTYSSM